MPEPVPIRLARVEEKLDLYHADMKRLFADEIKPMKEKIDAHSTQISRWRGAFSLLSLAWALLLAWFGYRG